GETTTHRGLGDFLRLLVRLVDVDVTTENKIVRRRFPTFITGDFAIVIERVFDLCRGLIDLSGRQVALHAPFDGFGAARRDPYRRIGLLQRARPDGTIFEMEKLCLIA